jgi:hypothetical protein
MLKATRLSTSRWAATTPVADLKYRRSTTDHGREGTAELAAAIPPNYPDARPAPGQRRLAANRRTYPQRPEQPTLTPSPRITRLETSGTPQQAKQTPAAGVSQAYGAFSAVDERSEPSSRDTHILDPPKVRGPPPPHTGHLYGTDARDLSTHNRRVSGVR